MTLHEFNQQPAQQKSDMVWEWGYYLANRRTGNLNNIIFLLGDLVVEICMNIAENKPESITAIAAGELSNECISAIKDSKPLIASRLFSYGPAALAEAA